MKAALLAILTWAPAQAGAFDLVFPVDCRLGDDCFIQQYMDRDAGPGARDFTCGPLSYDGHDGTDIGVPTTRDMLKGVAVRAAADGTVVRVRTAVSDNTVPGAPMMFPEGEECGNGLLLDHGEGWQTQYCHMRQSRTLLRPGDPVTAGQEIGQIGITGNTEFPHLHFILRKDGITLDPFAPDPRRETCTPPGGADPVWSDTTIAYQPGGILGVGLTDRVPSFDLIKHGLRPATSLPADAPALVMWVHFYGNRAGDRLQMTITGPDGPFDVQTEVLDRTQGRAFRAMGRRIADRPGWPVGRYRADAILLRGGVEIDRRWTVLDVR